jgi:hypothetical protein
MGLFDSLANNESALEQPLEMPTDSIRMEIEMGGHFIGAGGSAFLNQEIEDLRSRRLGKCVSSRGGDVHL